MHRVSRIKCRCTNFVVSTQGLKNVQGNASPMIRSLSPSLQKGSHEVSLRLRLPNCEAAVKGVDARCLNTPVVCEAAVKAGEGR